MRVCIVSATYVTQEPRVLRQIRTFRDRGWQISVVGYPGSNPVPLDWDFHDMTELQAVESPETPTIESTNTTPSLLSRIQSWGVSVRQRLTHAALHGSNNRDQRNLTEMRNEAARDPLPPSFLEALMGLASPRQLSIDEAKAIFFSEAKHVYFREMVAPRVPSADLVVAHDYFVLPLADLIAKASRAPMVMDIHEYAVEQYHLIPGTPASRYFDYVTRPMIEAFHRHYFPTLRASSCVAAGIARQLALDYDLAQTPTLIRSVPFYSQQPFRPVGESIDVLYHGLVNEARHLEVGVRSLALWRPEFRFTIRGPGPDYYIEYLRALAAELGVVDRLSIEPSVPFNDLVPVANQADIGYLAFMNYSRQREFASPNKFFEYIMAGLALVVMDVPELAPIVSNNANGRLITEFTPEAIAASINAFDRSQINACKKASIDLARDLCWENEQNRMISAYNLPQLESEYCKQL